MENRRCFIKQAVVGLLGVLGIGVGRIKCRGDIFCLPGIDPEDCPPIPKVKSPKSDYIEVSEEDVKLQGDFTICQWHHFIYNRVGSESELFLDGKSISGIVFKPSVFIKNFQITTLGDIHREEFWFKDT